MVILGFMLNYALRVNLTIAIVAMVEEPKDSAIPTVNQSDTSLLSNQTVDGATVAAHISAQEPFLNLTDSVSI